MSDHDPLCPWTEEIRLTPDTLAMDKKAPPSDECPSCHFIRVGRADERERIQNTIGEQ